MIVPAAHAHFGPSALSIQGQRGRIGLGYFEKKIAFCGGPERIEKSGSYTAAACLGIDREVEEFGFIGSRLAPGSEPHWCFINEGQQNRLTRVIAQRPLSGFGAAHLNTGDSGHIAGKCGADGNGTNILQ